MSLTRRSLLAALSAAPLLPAAAKKKILVLGGTGYLGPATIEAALARGHEVSMFNRGRTRPGLFPNVEHLNGDRDPNKDEGLNALRNRKWDAVIDNSGYVPRLVSASAKLLAPNVQQYIFISSISVYADNAKENQDETAKVGTTSDPTVETVTNDTYGPLKALCEQAASEAFPKRAAIVRPGFIVGPDDPSGRFTYWPVRVDKGGEVLAPGAPTDPIQIIDVRDLGAWLITLIENNTTGVFNACGPKDRLAWGDVLTSCQKAATSANSLTWVPVDWLRKEKGLNFPIWAPYTDDTRGFHTWNNTRAVKAGLKFRPHAETVADTLKWYKSQPADGRTKLAGPAAAREAELLAKWRQRA
jgi:2'-hydroxyisoflavone reductase